VSDVLSQDEITALLSAGGESEPASPAPEAAAAASVAAPATPGEQTLSVQSLDLMKRSVKGRLPGLDMILDQFSRPLRAMLANVYGKPPEITVAALDQLRFGPVQQAIQAPVGLQLFRLAPLRGQGLLVIPPEFLAAMVQVSFGGDPKRSTPLAKREFSAIESLILNKWSDRLLGYFRDAWRQVEPLECTRTRTETNPLFASIAGPQDIVLVIELRLSGEGLDNLPITFILPNASLDPIRHRLLEVGRPVEVDSDDGNSGWGTTLRAALGEVEVEVAAELGRRMMPMEAVLGLQVGDLITLGTGREGPVLLKVAGQARFAGTPGVSAGSNALQVTGRL
jgi:flagellar motor switch protein FliM